MIRFALVLAALLVLPSAVKACPPVQQLVSAQQVYAAPQAIVAAPVVYQPQVVQQIVAQPVSTYAIAAPIVQQQIVVKQQRVRRHPFRRAAQIVLPPYGCN